MNAVSNAPCNAVTPRVRGCVQNQIQNQTVVTSVLTSVVESQSQVKSVTRETIWLLVIAGLTVESSPNHKREPESRPRVKSLALGLRELEILNGWFRKFIIEDATGCWLWTGAKFRNGYGACGFRGTSTVAHRAIWQILIADLPRSLDLDHLCRNRACVNPEHLEPVTRSMNLVRGAHPTQGRLGRGAA